MIRFFLTLAVLFVTINVNAKESDAPASRTCAVVAGTSSDGGCFTKVQIAAKDVTSVCHNMEDSLKLIAQLQAGGLCAKSSEICSVERGSDSDGCFTVVKIGAKRVTTVCYDMNQSIELIKQLRAVGACQ